jgi:hypothetical protein
MNGKGDRQQSLRKLELRVESREKEHNVYWVWVNYPCTYYSVSKSNDMLQKALLGNGNRETCVKLKQNANLWLHEADKRVNTHNC